MSSVLRWSVGEMSDMWSICVMVESEDSMKKEERSSKSWGSRCYKK